MKKIIYLAFLSLLLIVSIQACKKDDSSSSASITPNLTNDIIQDGKWAVTYFSDKGVDNTNYFSNYLFQFSSSGGITATKNASTVSGIWQTSVSDSHVHFNLNFYSTNPFDELNEDWHVIEQSSTLLKLEDISGGNGGTKYLTFAKQ
jgi:hypothetical protein